VDVAVVVRKDVGAAESVVILTPCPCGGGMRTWRRYLRLRMREDRSWTWEWAKMWEGGKRKWSTDKTARSYRVIGGGDASA